MQPRWVVIICARELGEFASSIYGHNNCVARSFPFRSCRSFRGPLFHRDG
jgi:hypothetical protein